MTYHYIVKSKKNSYVVTNVLNFIESDRIFTNHIIVLVWIAMFPVLDICLFQEIAKEICTSCRSMFSRKSWQS